MTCCLSECLAGWKNLIEVGSYLSGEWDDGHMQVLTIQVVADGMEVFKRRYNVGQQIGKGGFGTVYAGVRNQDQLPVAIKVIPRTKVPIWGQVSIIVQFSTCLLRFCSYLHTCVR